MYQNHLYKQSQIDQIESIRIDSRAKSLGADHVAIVRCFNWLRKAVCSGKADQLPINFTDVARFYLKDKKIITCTNQQIIPG